jgi:hypothetical protein
MNKEYLPMIKIDNSDWLEQYKELLDAYEEAKLMILLNEIEYSTYDIRKIKPEIKKEAKKYDINGEGEINIVFNNSLDDHDFIKDILPESIFSDMLKKYNENEHDLVPHSIQIYPYDKKGIRISFHYGKYDDFDVESTYINESEMIKLLTYFIFYSQYAWHEMTFEDENNKSLEYDTASDDRKLIIKVIKNIQMKNINV